MIAILKLTNGLEVVGEIELDNIDYIVLSKPLQINYRYFTGPSPSVSFIRYIMFSEQHSITFNKNHVMNIARAREKFVDVYRHHARYYYEEHEKFINNELSSCVTPSSNETKEEDSMKKFLEMMSVEGAVVN